MLTILFAIICLINAVLATVVLATVNEVRDQNDRMKTLIDILRRHDEEIDCLVKDFNGMHNKMEKDYFNHMKDMNMLSKKIIALSGKGEKA